jgi:hypothetical protein
MSKRKTTAEIDPDATESDEDVKAAAVAPTKKARSLLPRSDLFEVKESLIEGAGLGLFVRSDLPDGKTSLEKGTSLGVYEGVRMTSAEFDAIYDTDEKRRARHYVMELPDADRTVIDAQDAVNSLTRYINHQKMDRANVVRYGPLKDHLMLSKRVKAGAELYYDYGDDYFDDEKRASPAKPDPELYVNVVPQGLKVTQSLLDGAGMGLFASGQSYVTGDRIIPYIGEELDEKQYESRYPTDRKRATAQYVLKLGSTWVDAVDPTKSSAARYINHKAGSGKNGPNARILKSGWIVATRMISDGDEIYMNYGPGYTFVKKAKPKAAAAAAGAGAGRSPSPPEIAAASAPAAASSGSAAANPAAPLPWWHRKGAEPSEILSARALALYLNSFNAS